MNTPTPTPRPALKATGMRRRHARCLETELTTLTAERNQLRAEVERLKTCGIVELAAINSSVLEYCKHWEARAERAEDNLAALEQCHDDNCRSVVKIADELAAERARLADLVADLSDACITLESAENDCDDYAMQSTAFKLMAVRNVFVAMKEATK